MRKLALVFVLLPILASTPCHAGVHWLCGLSEDATQLVCLADIEPAEMAPGSAPSPATAMVNGTQFPLDARRSYRVDFWSPATDLAHVDQLARATMCYRSRDCQVSFMPQAWARGAVRVVQRAD
jgi:hypothetical protein